MTDKAYFWRSIDAELLAWKESEDRKPLLLRGARQVGKSSAIRHLGKSFRHFIEINLEKRLDVLQLFSDNMDVRAICTQISVIYQTPIVPGETLLFIDEIQESERAIVALRYFYEDYPELHVVAAGSLLEFTLKELPSFGVGRIRSLYLYPFSFDEFLAAQGLQEQLAYKREEAEKMEPLSEPLHDAMVNQLRSFYIVGGMPAVVASWVKTGDYRRCIMLQNDIMATYQDDFKKYKSRISPLLLWQVLKSVVLQAGNKFVYAGVEGQYDTKRIKEALSLLELAGIVQPVIHTAANGLPLGAEINPRYQKYLMLDMGLMLSMLDMRPEDILLGNSVDFVNKGGLSEVFAGLELMKYAPAWKNAELYYWQRAERNAQAEVDYVIARQGNIIPLEVKASRSGSMQSLYRFLEIKHASYGIRTSLEASSEYNKVKVYPLYALSSIGV